MVHQQQASLARHLQKRIDAEWRWTTALLLVVVFTLSSFTGVPGLHRLNNILHDTLAQATVYRATSQAENIVIIAIDDNSIDRLGFWPWPRRVHAQLLRSLDGARAVGIDLLLSEHNPAYPADDSMLAQAIQKHGRVVLPSMLDPFTGMLTGPVPELDQATPHQGYINIEADPDGIVRSIQPHQVIRGQTLPHFIPALLQAADEEAVLNTLPDTSGGPLRIPWVGPAGTFKTVPYHKVLDGSIDAAAFNDKYVLIGAWSSGLGDVFTTPTTGSGPPTAGVEVLANILHATLANRWIRSPSDPTTGLLLLLPVFLACLACRFLSPQRAFLACVGLLGGILLTSAALLAWGLWWIGPSAGLLGCALAYPIWSWRSQHAVLAHINDELSLLDTDNPLETASSNGRYSRQTLMNRVAQLHQAIETFRQTRRRREETMRFLSHDMRAPLNSILALCEMQRHHLHTDKPLAHTEKLERYAHQTLTLVDGLVDLGRAEGKQLNTTTVNLADIIRQSCDNNWAYARSKCIDIVCDQAAEPAWVDAEPAMLERAFNNIIDNSIKYSPADNSIHVSLSSDHSAWIIKIQDSGIGMSAEALATIFEPFQRVPAHGTADDRPYGAGLGLAFVKIVIHRHKGSITVVSQPDQGTLFTIRLPQAEPSGDA